MLRLLRNPSVSQHGSGSRATSLSLGTLQVSGYQGERRPWGNLASPQWGRAGKCGAGGEKGGTSQWSPWMDNTGSNSILSVIGKINTENCHGPFEQDTCHQLLVWTCQLQTAVGRLISQLQSWGVFLSSVGFISRVFLKLMKNFCSATSKS